MDAALVPLERLGLSMADLVAAPASRPAVPTFAEYVPVVSAAVSAGNRRAYRGRGSRKAYAIRSALRAPGSSLAKT